VANRANGGSLKGMIVESTKAETGSKQRKEGRHKKNFRGEKNVRLVGLCAPHPLRGKRDW